MPRIPRDNSLDSTLALLSDGYTFIQKRCRRHRSDLFETRLMLRKAVCVTGEEAAAMFYGGDRFTRRHALPPTTLRLLQDKGSVALLDDAAHRQRKRMFMSLMSRERIRRLADVLAERWRDRIGQWESAGDVVLHDEAQGLLCRAACDWAGIPLAEPEAVRRTRELGAMIDGAGGVGPRSWRGLRLRARTERWGRDIVAKVRAGELDAPQQSAVNVIARHRDADGAQLDAKVAAVELINVLRPTVAVARFVTFAALALHEHPECRQRLAAGEDGYLDLFVQEVRRFYPFFPVVGGRARKAFEWKGYRFAAGTWVLLDLYGTNHDPRIWEAPQTFRPERFRDWNESPFNFIAQGGGDYRDNHRCPGEWITIELMKTAVRLLTTAMRYDVPAQNLHIDLSRMPAIPASRFVISGVRRAG